MASRLYCRRQGPGGDYCVTVRDGKLLLTLPNDNDPDQLWYEEGSYNNGFMLINKATGKAVRHSGVGVQLCLVNKPHCVDTSVLWTQSGNFGCGFTTFRPLSNPGLGMDAWNGHIFEGTLVSLYHSSTSDPTSIGENGQWKLVPACPTPAPHCPTPAPHCPTPAPHCPTPAPHCPTPAPHCPNPAPHCPTQGWK